MYLHGSRCCPTNICFNILQVSLLHFTYNRGPEAPELLKTHIELRNPMAVALTVRGQQILQRNDVVFCQHLHTSCLSS